MLDEAVSMGPSEERAADARARHQLRAGHRGVESGDLLQVAPHQNPSKYPRQKILIVRIDEYAYLVPFVEEDDHFFLRTIIPSRKATRDFIKKGKVE